MRTRKIARNTCQNALNMLRRCLERARETGLIKTNPAFGLSLPNRQEDLRAATRDNWTWLSLDEQNELLDAITTEERFIVQFALWTGLRKMEQFALRAEDDAGFWRVGRRVEPRRDQRTAWAQAHFDDGDLRAPGEQCAHSRRRSSASVDVKTVRSGCRFAQERHEIEGPKKGRPNLVFSAPPA